MQRCGKERPRSNQQHVLTWQVADDDSSHIGRCGMISIELLTETIASRFVRGDQPDTVPSASGGCWRVAAHEWPTRHLLSPRECRLFQMPRCGREGLSPFS